MSREARRRRWLARLETARRCERDLAAAELGVAQAELDRALAGIEAAKSRAAALVASRRQHLRAARSVFDLETVWETHVADEAALSASQADAHTIAQERDGLARVLTTRAARLHAAEKMHQRARLELQARIDLGERKLLDDLAPIMNARRADG